MRSKAQAVLCVLPSILGATDGKCAVIRAASDLFIAY
jgi:hypothetical protein